MKRVLLLLIIFGVNFLQVAGQNPSGFNYQAVIRSSNGEIIQNQSVGIRISILKGGVTGEAVYVETFSTETNNFGLVNLVIGTGNPKEGALSDVEWSSDSHFIKVEIDIQGGSNYTEMGTSQLLSVPYAMHAKSASQFKGEANSDPNAPLFEIKNSKGEIVFAVYENGVKIFIDEDEDGKTVGGFAVSGRTTTKEVQDLLTVAPGETRVYVDESSGKTVGGFAVSGRTTTKEVEDILHITTDNTQIYVGEGNGKTVGGFAVSGRTTTKGVEDILQITPDNTRIYVSESDGKTVGGFAVSGRTTTKEEGFYDVLKVVPERTDVFIKPSGNKSFPDGFSVSVYDEQLTPTELFNVSEEGIYMNNEVVIVPNVITGNATDPTQTSVSIGGTVLPYNGPPISHRGVTYSISPNPIADIQSSPSGEMGTITDYFPGDGFGEFDIFLDGLNPGTLYYYRAFAINQDGQIGYGAQRTFTTSGLYLLTFIVLEQGTETPIDNAMVTLESYDFNKTNDEGDYEFHVEEGDYNYSVIAEGYREDADGISVESDNTIKTVYLETSAYTVVFTVTNQIDDPLSGIYIFIEGAEAHYCTTNGLGKAIYSPPGMGEYTFEINAEGYEPYSGSFQVEDNNTVYLPIILQELPKYTVTFHVLDPWGEPLENAMVHLEEGYKKNGEKAYYNTLFTDMDGYVVFYEVPENQGYLYEISHLDYSFQSVYDLEINDDMFIEVYPIW